MSMKYVKPEIISLKNHVQYNEKWLQARIEEDPSIIGLGELELRGSEKIHRGAGRLDAILFSPDENRRYEVEIQLGKTDESHIIRTLEYWDLERKKNPQYEHCAVIIAEDITSRFLNVISLFNGFIPLIAIQVKAVKIGENISLFFTKVLDEMRLDLLEEDIKAEPTDRNYWEKKVGKNSLIILDNIYSELSDIIGDFKLKYNKHYIGLEQNDITYNFIYFNLNKKNVIMNIRLDKADEIDAMLESTDLDVLNYDKQWRIYRFRIREKDLESNLELIKKITKTAKNERFA